MADPYEKITLPEYQIVAIVAGQLLAEGKRNAIPNSIIDRAVDEACLVVGYAKRAVLNGKTNPPP